MTRQMMLLLVSVFVFIGDTDAQDCARMPSIAAKIQCLEEKHAMDEQRRQREHAEWEREWKERSTQANKGFLHAARGAAAHDYAQWLRGFLLQGGTISHNYDYPMPTGRGGFYVAGMPCVISPLYGAASVSLIVPADVECTIDGLGHIDVYFMDGFTHMGIVPLYSDVKRLLLRD